MLQKKENVAAREYVSLIKLIEDRRDDFIWVGFRKIQSVSKWWFVRNDVIKSMISFAQDDVLECLNFNIIRQCLELDISLSPTPLLKLEVKNIEVPPPHKAQFYIDLQIQDCFEFRSHLLLCSIYCSYFNVPCESFSPKKSESSLGEIKTCQIFQLFCIQRRSDVIDTIFSSVAVNSVLIETFCLCFFKIEN